MAVKGSNVGRKVITWLGGAVVGFVLCAALIGGTAFAATGSPSSATNLGQAFIDKLAQNLGISSADLQSKIKQSGDETVDDAVTNGQLSQDQGNRLKQRIDNGNGADFFGGFDGFGHGRMGMGVGIDLDTIASTLGMSTADLQTALHNGTAMTDIITQHGKTVDDVVNALVANAKTQLDQAVTAGKLTQAQEDQLLTNLPTRLTDMLNNGVGPKGGPWGGPRHNPDTDPSSGTPDDGV